LGEKPDLAADHTACLEQRLKAVQIYARDTCSFFSQRDGSVISLRKCRYCEYARFQSKIIDEDSKGICKFKP
jgi:hypothetical protein